MQMPPSLPSWILFLLRVGLLSVLIHTPAIALSKISLSSIKPKPERHIFMFHYWGNRQELLSHSWNGTLTKATEATDSLLSVNKVIQPQQKTTSWGTKKATWTSLLLTWVVNQNASILASPDLVPPDLGIAASPVKKRTHKLSRCFTNAKCFFPPVPT